jgi:hypothetical protein
VASVLDIRRLSIFDAAAATVGVRSLDEHYRSLPHLIEFSTTRFYADRLHIATRHPNTEGIDAIEVVEVGGSRVDEVNVAEIDVLMARLRADLGSGCESVGVITPFRAQHDAIEERIAEELTLDEVRQLNLRLGTVHGFQGGQRDRIYVSLTIDDNSSAGSLRFLSDRNLFNVMVTRARRQMIMLTSGGASPGGVLDDYLRYAAQSSVTQQILAVSDWTNAVAGALSDAAIPVRVGYPVGRHTIDIVLPGDLQSAPTAMICGVHPDGVAMHIERHLDLVRSGWVVQDVYASRWKENLAGLAVSVVSERMD